MANVSPASWSDCQTQCRGGLMDRIFRPSQSSRHQVRLTLLFGWALFCLVHRSSAAPWLINVFKWTENKRKKNNRYHYCGATIAAPRKNWNEISATSSGAAYWLRQRHTKKILMFLWIALFFCFCQLTSCHVICWFIHFASCASSESWTTWFRRPVDRWNVNKIRPMWCRLLLWIFK